MSSSAADDGRRPAGRDQLVERAARYGVDLDGVSARTLAPLGDFRARRKVDDVCRLIRHLRHEDVEWSFRQALGRLDACGGDVEEAVRRHVAGGLEFRDGIAETVAYAAVRGVVLAPHSVYYLFKSHGRDGTRRYVDGVARIMDAAARLGIDCSQLRAAQLLGRAGGDHLVVIAGFEAERRRRVDRRVAPCAVSVPPRVLEARANALAGCGCPRCCERLAVQLQPYIGKMIAAPRFAELDRELARAEANFELLRSVETWPGGRFTGWFAARFKHRAQHLIEERRREARQQVVSLDGPSLLAYDDGGREVPLGERIPDLTVDVLTTVLFRERVAEREQQRRQERAERGEEYDDGDDGEDWYGEGVAA